jgi:NAD(P)-dependent dehydrogenase (short-subunit alcohol dehydrogenase family)
MAIDQETVALVTGATNGIGYVTARGLAERGATVVLVARNSERADASVARIKQQTGNQSVEYLLADLSSQAQVRRVAEDFARRHDRLHILVNNAGALFWTRQRTVDGLEMTFAVNHLAPFLLTNLLLPAIQRGAPARIVTVASAAHAGATIPFDDLQNARGRYSPLRAYGRSKLANILFTYELARRLEGTEVTANAVHPGFVGTGFGKGGPLSSLVMNLVRPFTLSPEQGAQTSLYVATSPEVAGVSGKYFVDRKPVRSSPASYDEATARRLWQVSEDLTGLASPA